MEIHGIGTPRRIVTGMREDGKSHLARVEEVEELDYAVSYPFLANMPEDERPTELHRIWASDSWPFELPTDGYAPPIDASVVNGHEVLPPSTPEETPEVLRRVSPQPATHDGLRVSVVKFRPGMGKMPIHWHDTVDLRFVIAGEVTLLLDDGTEVTARAGDCIVANGDNHGWECRDPEGCVLGVVLMGAKRVGRTPPSEDNFAELPTDDAGSA